MDGERDFLTEHLLPLIACTNLVKLDMALHKPYTELEEHLHSLRSNREAYIQILRSHGLYEVFQNLRDPALDRSQQMLDEGSEALRNGYQASEVNSEGEGYEVEVEEPDDQDDSEIVDITPEDSPVKECGQPAESVQVPCECSTPRINTFANNGELACFRCGGWIDINALIRHDGDTIDQTNKARELDYPHSGTFYCTVGNEDNPAMWYTSIEDLYMSSPNEHPDSVRAIEFKRRDRLLDGGSESTEAAKFHAYLRGSKQ